MTTSITNTDETRGCGVADYRAMIDWNSRDGAIGILEFHEMNTCTTSQFSGLRDAANTSQAAFDTAATAIWGTWYSGRSTTDKTGCRTAFLNLPD